MAQLHNHTKKWHNSNGKKEKKYDFVKRIKWHINSFSYFLDNEMKKYVQSAINDAKRNIYAE